ncbi:MAG: DUF4315 family protein, partial [Oscillospiraceae bacterium]
QKTEAENLQIVSLVRSMRVTPEELTAMLGGNPIPGIATVNTKPHTKQEDTDHEE